MAILNTLMVSSTTQVEYGILLTDKVGCSSIYHLNKDFEKINPIIHTLVEARDNPIASGRHYFVNEKKENPPNDVEISLVEIMPTYPTETLKWEAKDFLQGYLDFHQSFRFQSGGIPRKVGYSNRPSLVSFESFINFFNEAFPTDYQNWKLLESDLRWVRKTFTLPTLP